MLISKRHDSFLKKSCEFGHIIKLSPFVIPKKEANEVTLINPINVIIPEKEDDSTS